MPPLLNIVFRRFSGWPLSVALAVALGPAPAAAQDVRAYVSRDTVSVGDRFTLSVVADHTGEAAPLFPPHDDAEAFGDLEVISASNVYSRLLEGPGGRRQDSVLYEVTTFALDTAQVPTLPLFFMKGPDTLQLDTDAFLLPVRSLVPAEAEGIRNLAPLATFPVAVWPWLLAAAVLAGMGYAAYRYLNRPQAPAPEAAPALTPVEAPFAYAMRRLNELQERVNLNDLKGIKPYYVELSEILRIYFSRRLRIPAMESTTFELTAMLKRRAEARVIPEEALPRAQQIFRVMDLVKFADLLPPPHVGQEALVRTRTLIEMIEGKLSSQETPTPTESQPVSTQA
jgi:hypothetical protein